MGGEGKRRDIARVGLDDSTPREQRHVRQQERCKFVPCLYSVQGQALAGRGRRGEGRGWLLLREEASSCGGVEGWGRW